MMSYLQIPEYGFTCSGDPEELWLLFLDEPNLRIKQLPRGKDPVYLCVRELTQRSYDYCFKMNQAPGSSS